MKFVAPGPVGGVLRAPASKSHVQRLLLAASLGEGPSCIQHPGHSDDVQACARVVAGLGARVDFSPGACEVFPGSCEPVEALHCGESGFCLRSACALAALQARPFELQGSGSLLKRPVSMIEAPLRALGVFCESLSGKPPLRITGPYQAGHTRLDGRESSQFLSGLLLALPKANGEFVIEVDELKSFPYVRMTLEVLTAFQVEVHASSDLATYRIRGPQRYHPVSMEAEGDWSGAAFLLVAGGLAGSPEGVVIEGLSERSSQADIAILGALEAAGIKTYWENQKWHVTKGPVRAFNFDATDCPDLFPPLAALACHGNGVSRIQGVSRLRHKESDRAMTLQSEFQRMGARIDLEGDWMHVHGGPLKGGEIDSHKDHRIAMACATAALCSGEGVAIRGEECVGKSYPAFFEDLAMMMGAR